MSSETYAEKRKRQRKNERKYHLAHKQERNEASLKYYYAHRQRLIQKQREYYKNNREGILATKRVYREKRKHELEQKRKKWRVEHPNAAAAQLQALRHVLLAEKCEICGSTEHLERHHPNYDKPLDVRTLCRSCHQKIHRGL